VFALADGGLGVTATARQLRVTPSYLSKVLSRRRATGETTARPQLWELTSLFAPVLSGVAVANGVVYAHTSGLYGTLYAFDAKNGPGTGWGIDERRDQRTLRFLRSDLRRNRDNVCERL
jgi:PQQ-like domain